MNTSKKMETPVTPEDELASMLAELEDDSGGVAPMDSPMGDVTSDSELSGELADDDLEAVLEELEADVETSTVVPESLSEADSDAIESDLAKELDTKDKSTLLAFRPPAAAPPAAPAPPVSTSKTSLVSTGALNPSRPLKRFEKFSEQIKDQMDFANPHFAHFDLDAIEALSVRQRLTLVNLVDTMNGSAKLHTIPQFALSGFFRRLVDGSISAPMTTADLSGFLQSSANGGKQYSRGTANSQAGIIMHVLTAAGALERTGTGRKSIFSFNKSNNLISELG